MSRNSFILARWLLATILGFELMTCTSEEFNDAQEKSLAFGSEPRRISDNSSPNGTWYLRANGFRLELSIYPNGQGIYSGTIKNEGGSEEPVTNISWDNSARWLQFRRDGNGFYQWYRLSLVHGVVAGRFSHRSYSSKPGLTAFAYHVTGWNPAYTDDDIVPRTWDVTVNNNYNGVLRIDRNSSGSLVGTLKIFDNRSVGGVQEELEHQLSNISWNGQSLSFKRNGNSFYQTFTGTVNGRTITGTFSHNNSGAYPWTGTRSQVLGFGLGSRINNRSAWQARTRARILNLTEGMRLINTGIPTILATRVSCTGCPFTSGIFPDTRDDNPNAWPPNYRLEKYRFEISPGNRFDPSRPAPLRTFYGYLAMPTSTPPAGGFRAMVFVNGHSGSAKKLVTSSDPDYWHGESAARRYLAVLSLDIGHRSEWHDDYTAEHPAIIGNGYSSSDWEEDGERAFSVRRAIDWLVQRPNIRTDRIFMGGLSMGGEVTTITAALDPRIRFTVVAGYSPDMHVMDNHGNHPCYKWNNADIHEYLDVSDYEALIAPRPLLIQTGIADMIFSSLSTPFASDKQLLRRARAAYGSDAAKLIHYLHGGTHQFQVGDINPSTSMSAGIRVPTMIEPQNVSDISWQTDANTYERSPTLYHLMNELVP